LEVIKIFQDRTPPYSWKTSTIDPSKRTELEALGATVVPIVTGDWWEVFPFGFSNVSLLGVFRRRMTTSLHGWK